MMVSERIDALIAKLPALAKQHPDVREFWRVVDAEVEPISAAVENEADQRALDARYSDLMAEADVMGMIQPD
jgi:hypothetical protein